MIEACSADGASWAALESCAAPAVCAGGGCGDCAPGTTVCVEAGLRAVCDETGSLSEPAQCPAWAPSCVGTECVPALAVATGGAHACVRRAGADVVCWGENSAGQLGTGDGARRRSAASDPPLEAPPLGSPVRDVAAGGAHTCVLLEGGFLKCWGENDSGQLGLGDTERRGDEPGEIAALPAVDLGSDRVASAVTAGSRHTCALLEGGTIKCWGANESGQLGLGDTENRGDDSLELGENLRTALLTPDVPAIALDAGAAHTCAVLSNGRVTCWGANAVGQLGTGDTESHGANALGPGASLPHVLIDPARRATAVGAGGDHSCALLDDGSVVCWGYNRAGQLGVGDSANRSGRAENGEMDLAAVDFGASRSALGIAVGASHSCALLSDRAVKCWGINGRGTLGLGSTEMGRGDDPAELGDALPVVDLGSRDGVPWPAAALDAGIEFGCAVLDGAVVKCWGLNASGQLGLGDSETRGDGPDELGDRLPAVALD
jgi:alpha-tubulin suppressor-like RCC1 family protein